MTTTPVTGLRPSAPLVTFVFPPTSERAAMNHLVLSLLGLAVGFLMLALMYLQTRRPINMLELGI
jgi:hypothetical protein